MGVLLAIVTMLAVMFLVDLGVTLFTDNTLARYVLSGVVGLVTYYVVRTLYNRDENKRDTRK